MLNDTYNQCWDSIKEAVHTAFDDISRSVYHDGRRCDDYSNRLQISIQRDVEREGQLKEAEAARLIAENKHREMFVQCNRLQQGQRQLVADLRAAEEITKKCLKCIAHREAIQEELGAPTYQDLIQHLRDKVKQNDVPAETDDQSNQHPGDSDEGQPSKKRKRG